MQTRGTESIFASAMPVIRFVAPGPLVAIATPTLPVTRANPSAANTAPCSCRVRLFLAVFRQPTHHAAQLRPHDLDGMLLLFRAQSREILSAALVFRNPFARELAALNVGQD